MSKDNKAGQRASRQPKPTKIIVEKHYAGTEIQPASPDRTEGWACGGKNGSPDAPHFVGSTFKAWEIDFRCGVEIRLTRGADYVTLYFSRMDR